LKRYDEAIETFKALEKVNPSSLMSPYYLGKINMERQRYPEALAEFRRAIAIRDDFEPAYTSMGMVYELMNRPGDAIESYKKALAVNPRDLEVMARLAQLYISRTRSTMRWNSSSTSWPMIRTTLMRTSRWGLSMPRKNSTRRRWSLSG
jgi:tetratricopeptide (TPR) repeat protein